MKSLSFHLEFCPVADSPGPDDGLLLLLPQLPLPPLSRRPEVDAERPRAGNKHLDCLQYKCSLCKSIKNSRLAFDCHVRSRHSVDNNSRDHRTIPVIPLFRLKRPFAIKAERLTKSKGGRGQLHQLQQLQHNLSQRSASYDLQFVTFLRSMLASDVGGTAAAERTGDLEGVCVTSWHWATPSQGPAHPLAEWLHKEQGIFRINCREEFAKKWFQLKV